MLKDRKLLILPPLPCLRLPLGENPLECRDEIWHHKQPRVMGLPRGEEIMTYISSF